MEKKSTNDSSTGVNAAAVSASNINKDNEQQQQHNNNDSNSNNSSSDNSLSLPIEYQLYDEVDITNPNMDPLEYTVRKYIPIPKAYFWDTTNEMNEYNTQLPPRIKAWHYSIYYLGEVLKKAEAGGEIVANILGLNSGPFDYVTDHMTSEQMAQSQANVDRRRDAESVEMLEGEERKKEEVGGGGV